MEIKYFIVTEAPYFRYCSDCGATIDRYTTEQHTLWHEHLTNLLTVIIDKIL